VILSAAAEALSTAAGVATCGKVGNLVRVPLASLPYPSPRRLLHHRIDSTRHRTLCSGTAPSEVVCPCVLFVMMAANGNINESSSKKETVESMDKSASRSGDGEPMPTDAKMGEYIRELMEEKHKLDASQWPNASRLLEQGKLLRKTNNHLASDSDF